MITLLAPIIDKRNIIHLRKYIAPTVYYHGAAGVDHDATFAGLIEGADVEFGNYCWADPDIFDLILSYPMDIVISGREGSIDCLYSHPDLPMIPITGFGNRSETTKRAIRMHWLSATAQPMGLP